MKKILFILSLISLQSIFAQYGQTIDVSDALKAALDIRTSGVRITKDYVYKGLKSDFIAKENDNNLSKGEKALLTLEIYSKSYPEITDDLNVLKSNWKKARRLALQKPDRKKMRGLLTNLRKFIQLSNILISDVKKTNHLNIIDYQESANQMELLSQQITLLYALQVAKINDPALHHEMRNCKINFQKNLDKTFYSGENTIEVSDALKKIQADWELSKRGLDKNGQEQLLNTLYVMMNKISKQSRKAAQFYQKMAKDKLKK